MKEKNTTIALTSCGRFSLLKRTINSLSQSIDFSLYEKVLIEDSGNEKIIAQIKNECSSGFLCGRTVIFPEKKHSDPYKSHQNALLYLYSHIKTKYVFHCEDDWFFKKVSFDFISLSEHILHSDKSIGIVGLRDVYQRSETNLFLSRKVLTNQWFDDSSFVFFGHDFIKLKDYSNSSRHYTLNPGLRRRDETLECLEANRNLAVDEYKMGEIQYQQGTISIVFLYPIVRHTGGLFFSTRFFKDGFFLSLIRVLKNGFRHYYLLFFK